MEAYFGQKTPRSLVLLFLVAAFAMVAVRSLRYQGLQRKVHPSALAIKLQKFWVSPESWLHVRSKNWEGGLAKGGDQRCLQELRRRWRRIRSQQYLGDRSRDKQPQTPAVSHGLDSAWRQLPCSVPLHTIHWPFNIHSPRVSPTKDLKEVIFWPIARTQGRTGIVSAGEHLVVFTHVKPSNLFDTHRSINGFTLLYVIPPTAS